MAPAYKGANVLLPLQFRLDFRNWWLSVALRMANTDGSFTRRDLWVLLFKGTALVIFYFVGSFLYKGIDQRRKVRQLQAQGIVSDYTFFTSSHDKTNQSTKFRLIFSHIADSSSFMVVGSP